MSKCCFFFIVCLDTLLFSVTRSSAQSPWTRHYSGTSADLYGVCFLDESLGYAVGDSGVFLKTVDGGATWSKSSLGNLTLRAIQFLDTTTGYAVGYYAVGMIFRTTDGGKNWDTMATTSGWPLAEHFINKDTGIVVGYGYPGLIRKTTDGGKTWTDLSHNHGVNTSQYITAVQFINDSVGFITSGSSAPGFPRSDQVDYLGQINKTTDGGETWEPFLYVTPFSSITFADDLVGFAAGLWGAWVKSTDGGNTWEGEGTASLAYLFYMGQLNGTFFISRDTGWTIGTADSAWTNGLIASTTNGGQTWQTEDSFSTGSLYSITLSDNNSLWVVGAKGTILERERVTPVRRAGNRRLDFSLDQNYPNPFNPSTLISYRLTAFTDVELKTYDILGREVKTLLNDEEPAGQHSVRWDGTDQSGQRVASGVYYFKLATPGGSVTKKAVLIR